MYNKQKKQFDIMEYSLAAGFVAVATATIPWENLWHAIFG